MNLFYHLQFFINHELSRDQSCFNRFALFFSRDILHHELNFHGVNNCDQDNIRKKYAYLIKNKYIHSIAKDFIPNVKNKNIPTADLK